MRGEMRSIKDILSNYKELKEYTDRELYDFLCQNQTMDLLTLAGICSEILRRQLSAQLDKNEEI